jgi:MFS family permease
MRTDFQLTTNLSTAQLIPYIDVPVANKTRAKARKAGRAKRGPQEAKPADSLPAALPPPAAAAIVFVAAGAVLMLEILAVRLLAPYVGLTLQTTTAIIGAALAGIAAGAAIGGYLADRTNTRRLVVWLLVVGGLLALLIVPVVRWLGPGAQGGGNLAALGITFVTLVPAALVLSAVSPAVAHLQLHDLRASGTVVGRLSAWATAGALIGTFGTGFVLVPLMPVSSAVLMIGVVLVLAGAALGTTSQQLSSGAAAGVAVATIALGGMSASLHSPCTVETAYNCVVIEADAARPGGYELILDGGYNSYVDLNDPTHLDYSYTRWIADGIDAMNRPKAPLDAVFVGGGGFTLPEWLAATRPGSRSEVLELDAELVGVDEERLGLHTSPALRARTGDARISMLDVPSDSADVVVGDAFSHHTIPWHLMTTEWLDEVKRVLKPGGLYALNVIDFPPLDLLRAEAATLLDSFADVRLAAVRGRYGQPYGGNEVLYASDRPMPKRTGSSAEGAVTYNREDVEAIAGNAETLRDDYAPVDQLITRPE